MHLPALVPYGECGSEAGSDGEEESDNDVLKRMTGCSSESDILIEC